jgi:DNA polymerase
VAGDGGAATKKAGLKPNAREIAACRPWLNAELELIEPDVVVALGATAAQALMGPAFRVTRDRGKPFTGLDGAKTFVATVHPSSILRGDPVEREAALAALVTDLKVVAKLI